MVVTACPWEPFAAAVMMSKPSDSSHASWLDQFCILILSTMTGEHLKGKRFLLHAHQPQCFSDTSDQVLCYSTCTDIACFRSILNSSQSKQEPLYLYFKICTTLSLSCSLTLCWRVTSPQIRPLSSFSWFKLRDEASSRGSSVKRHFFPLMLLSWRCAAPDLQRVQKKPETMWTAQ